MSPSRLAVQICGLPLWVEIRRRFIQEFFQEKDLLELGNTNGNHPGTWESIGNLSVTQ